jgi:hypothetical protein
MSSLPLIDLNAHLGPWPFAPVPERRAAALQKHLAAHGIRRAFVSHLGTVFRTDPMPDNRRLLADTAATPALLPVPTINPALANWRDQLDAGTADPRVYAVKIFSNYHGYRLGGRRAADLARELIRRRLPLLLQVRLVDDRHRYFGLRVKGVPAADVAAFLQRHADLRIVCLGLQRDELQQVAAKVPCVHADLSFAEWLWLLDAPPVPPAQLFFGSHTPLFVTRAIVDKLTRSGAPATTIATIANKNARRFFGL